MTHDEDDAPAAPQRTRFQQARTLAKWCLGFVAVVALVLFLGRAQVGRVGQRQLDATVQRLDADDPGWRFEAVHEARKKNEPPAAENAALEILDLADRIPPEFRDWQRSPEAAKFWTRDPDNHLPPPDALAAARKAGAPAFLVRTQALQLRNRRAGQFPLTIEADVFATQLPHLDKSRQVLSLLQFDGALAALDKNPNRGISAARAALTVARAIGDEPFLVSQLVRIACAKIAAQTAMQVLAWGEPTDGLAELQAELLTEADANWFLVGMRGERALVDRTFQGMADGTISAETAFRYAEGQKPGPQHYAAFRAYKALLPGDRAKYLQLSTEYVEAAKLPPQEQLAALKQVQIPPGPPDDFRYIFTRVFLPATEKVAEAGLRTRADLLVAATCVACERFRSKHGRWPRELTELAPTYLTAVPTNPFDGRPIGYRVFPDRVAVYSFWANAPLRLDSAADDFQEGEAAGVGIGYRVWTPSQRALPARPEEKKDP